MKEIRAKCGTRCDRCSFRERFDCKGCSDVCGKPFWGECNLYACASEKGLMHCGDCGRFPCAELLTAIQNGHQPDRLENLMQWRNESAE